MGIALAFALGYLAGANAGHDGYQEVVESMRAVRESDEFRGLVSAVRSHASATLRQLGDLIDETAAEPATPAHLLARVRTLVGRGTATSPAT